MKIYSQQIHFENNSTTILRLYCVLDWLINFCLWLEINICFVAIYTSYYIYFQQKAKIQNSWKHKSFFSIYFISHWLLHQRCKYNSCNLVQVTQP